MTESAIILNKSGGASYVGPDATHLYRVMVTRTAIKMWMATGINPSRGVTITKLLAVAGQVTGKVYKSRHAPRALADLDAWIVKAKGAIPIIDERAK
jgi:hypothetical protein